LGSASYHVVTLVVSGQIIIIINEHQRSIELTERLLKKMVKLKVMRMIDFSPGEPEQYDSQRNMTIFLTFSYNG